MTVLFNNCVFINPVLSVLVLWTHLETRPGL